MKPEAGPTLVRSMSLLGLASTGICSMLGASIYIVPIMIQRNVPGIGPYVLPAFLFASIPAVLAAFAYAILSSAMPRAGGSYLYASRGLSPYLGFVASFSQWFGLSIAIGVVSYVIPPFIRDVAAALGLSGLARALNTGPVRLVTALSLLWIFVYINIKGIRLYERILIPLMILMFVLGAVVIVTGFVFGHEDFAAALLSRTGKTIPPGESAFSLPVFLSASAVLFSSFIGFDSIAQAGGEAKNPTRALPLAIGIAVLSVGTFYFLFTAAVYHAVPWTYIAQEASTKDLTAPGVMSYLLPAGWTLAIIAGAAVALTNDLPAMLLSVSRLMFAWAEDGIFPKMVTKIHPQYHTPYIALVISGFMASLGIVGCYLAGDFFLGVDILVTSMLVNFTLICLSVITIPKVNPPLAAAISVFKSRPLQIILGVAGVVLLLNFLHIHIIKDLHSGQPAWYFHTTFIWLMVMGVASIIYFRELKKLKKSGVDTHKHFLTLPPE